MHLSTQLFIKWLSCHQSSLLPLFRNCTVSGMCAAHPQADTGNTHRITGKQRLLVDHLCKNAANAPQVHRRRVVFDAQQDLRGSVPQGDDLQVVLKGIRVAAEQELRGSMTRHQNRLYARQEVQVYRELALQKYLPRVCTAARGCQRHGPAQSRQASLYLWPDLSAGSVASCRGAGCCSEDNRQGGSLLQVCQQQHIQSASACSVHLPPQAPGTPVAMLCKLTGASGSTLFLAAFGRESAAG